MMNSVVCMGNSRVSSIHNVGRSKVCSGICIDVRKYAFEAADGTQ